MIETKAYEARGPAGEIRVDYSFASKEYTLLLERVGDGMLYSKFDGDGITLFRSMEKATEIAPSAEGINGLIGLIASETQSDVEMVSADYSPVRIKRKCPSCGAESLERHTSVPDKGLESVPAVPRYKCASCGQECYHVSDEYLAALVRDNHALFSSSEMAQLESDPEGFMGELKEHISRVFAMKNIRRII